MVYLENKKGWIRIVEAFVSILLIVGTLLILIVLNAMDSTPPIEISSHDETETLNLGSGDGEFPTEVWDRIEDRLTKDFGYLECRAKISGLQNICALSSYPDKDVYARAIAISVDITTNYQPRQLKLFCWKR